MSAASRASRPSTWRSARRSSRPAHARSRASFLKVVGGGRRRRRRGEGPRHAALVPAGRAWRTRSAPAASASRSASRTSPTRTSTSATLNDRFVQRAPARGRRRERARPAARLRALRRRPRAARPARGARARRADPEEPEGAGADDGRRARLVPRHGREVARAVRRADATRSTTRACTSSCSTASSRRTSGPRAGMTPDGAHADRRRARQRRAEPASRSATSSASGCRTTSRRSPTKTPLDRVLALAALQVLQALELLDRRRRQVQAHPASRFESVTVIHGHTHQLLTNRIGNIHFHGMLSTAWPWPYAPEGLPEADRADEPRPIRSTRTTAAATARSTVHAGRARRQDLQPLEPQPGHRLERATWRRAARRTGRRTQPRRATEEARDERTTSRSCSRLALARAACGRRAEAPARADRAGAERRRDGVEVEALRRPRRRRTVRRPDAPLTARAPGTTIADALMAEWQQQEPERRLGGRGARAAARSCRRPTTAALRRAGTQGQQPTARLTEQDVAHVEARDRARRRRGLDGLPLRPTSSAAPSRVSLRHVPPARGQHAPRDLPEVPGAARPRGAAARHDQLVHRAPGARARPWPPTTRGCARWRRTSSRSARAGAGVRQALVGADWLVARRAPDALRVVVARALARHPTVRPR